MKSRVLIRRLGALATLTMASLGSQSALAQIVPPPSYAIQVSPEVQEQVGIDQRLGTKLPLDVTFTNESGQAVQLSELVRKPTILSFVYYECPSLCTLILNGMVRAFNVMDMKVGREFDVISVSIDPRETPDIATKKKRGYGKVYNGGTKLDDWHFLTSDEANVKRLADAAGFRYTYDQDREQYAHASAIVVLTPDGTLSKYFYGVEYSPRDLRLALVEAADGKIGSPVDQMLLYCFQYDPVTGKYGLVIMNALRLAGGLTLLILGGFVLVSLLRERARRKLTPKEVEAH